MKTVIILLILKCVLLHFNAETNLFIVNNDKTQYNKLVNAPEKRRLFSSEFQITFFCYVYTLNFPLLVYPFFNV